MKKTTTNSATISKLRSIIALCALFGAGSVDSIQAAAAAVPTVIPLDSSVGANQDLLISAKDLFNNYDIHKRTDSFKNSALLKNFLHENNISALPDVIIKTIDMSARKSWLQWGSGGGEVEFNSDQFNTWLTAANNTIADYKRDFRIN